MALLEKSPVVYLLLQDGVDRALAGYEPQVKNIVHQRMQLLPSQDAIVFMQRQAASFDVVYLDPMFPERKKSAKVKKAMQYFHDVVGMDVEQEQRLFSLAYESAGKRVVVKRPKGATLLADQSPSFQLKAKSVRYDVYLKSA